MNVLPWLLDWPPKPATVALFLLVTAFSVGTVVLFGGVTDETTNENVTIDVTEVTVRLNDAQDLPDTNGTIETCIASGTPGDSISVLGDVVVDIPTDRRAGNQDRRFQVVVSLAHTDETTTSTIEGTGHETATLFWLLEDDETLAVGDTAKLSVRVQEAGSTLTTKTRPVTIEAGSRSYDC